MGIFVFLYMVFWDAVKFLGNILIILHLYIYEFLGRPGAALSQEPIIPYHLQQALPECPPQCPMKHEFQLGWKALFVALCENQTTFPLILSEWLFPFS